MSATSEASSNVDPAELAKFGALAARWWDPHSEFKPLHDINPLRLGYIDRVAGLKGKRVLDVGCGGGILSEAMCSAGASVTGIDVGEKPLKVAQMHLLESNLDVEYRNITVEELAEERAHEYDVITCMDAAGIDRAHIMGASMGGRSCRTSLSTIRQSRHRVKRSALNSLRTTTSSSPSRRSIRTATKRPTTRTSSMARCRAHCQRVLQLTSP